MFLGNNRTSKPHNPILWTAKNTHTALSLHGARVCGTVQTRGDPRYTAWQWHRSGLDVRSQSALVTSRHRRKLNIHLRWWWRWTVLGCVFFPFGFKHETRGGGHIYSSSSEAMVPQRKQSAGLLELCFRFPAMIDIGSVSESFASHVSLKCILFMSIKRIKHEHAFRNFFSIYKENSTRKSRTRHNQT